MKKQFLRIFCLVLVLLMLIPILAACNDNTTPPTNDTGDPDNDQKDPTPDDPNNPGNDDPGDTTGFEPILRFAVASDIHLRTSTDNLNSFATLQKLMTSAYAYSDSQKYNKLDGMFIVGDYTQNGSDAEMKKFHDYVNSVLREETTFRTVLGNHEFWDTGRYTPSSLAATFEKYLSYGGYDEVDQHITIGDYHFIILNMDRYDGTFEGSRYFSPEKIEWLDAELAKAAATDPSGTRPIFVFQHIPAESTVNNVSQTTKDDPLREVFSKYPQAVDFAGHSHIPVLDPRSIWQGDYTTINTGSLCYSISYLSNHPSVNYVISMDNDGAWATGDIETAVRNACMYQFVEINAENEIRLVIYNIFSDKVEKIIELGKVGDPDTYTFNDSRKENADTPAFDDGATLTVEGVSKSSLTIRIPQASGETALSNYRAELYRGNQKVATEYAVASAFLGSAMPESVKVIFRGLEPGTEYLVKVYPVNFWGVEGVNLRIKATTAEKVVLGDDLISIKFNEDGSATNTVDNVTLSKHGNATTVLDETLGKYVGLFDGKSSYTYTDMADIYPEATNGFSFEIYINLDNLDVPAGYLNTVSNQQAGGFGFELKQNGEMQFLCHTGSAYERVSATVTAGTWTHLVATYDKNTLSIYKDGELVASKNTSGHSLKLPNADSQYLCIGGDSDASASGTSFMSGRLADINLYNNVLTAEEVAEIYQKVTE